MTDLENKQVLVTGGCGSIGSELVERLLDYEEPAVVRVFDNDEAGLFDLKTTLDSDRLRFLLGDVRDRNRLEMAMEDIDVVFHAAALKHVGLNEYNPFETVQTNALGTQNLIRAAMEENVEAFVTISTDKASNPTSVMGATKLLSERLTIAANTYKGEQNTEFGCVRFGNVFGSSGSVVPLFLDQISDGGPMTVTNREMTRFIMPIEEATDLVFDAYERMEGGETFVLKMPVFRLMDLAEAMRTEYAPQFGYDPSEVEIHKTGKRPGERIHEKLISKDEIQQTIELDEMFVITPLIEDCGYDPLDYESRNSLDAEYTSADVDPLSKSEIIAMIENTSAYETMVEG
ncbi:polysaccharide biosynthesis protein [Halorussus caseinilyticus]|uniref:polysaccharide biosynthesis protein n=1 Tax=Halorussus caseinilyticus TaxID=3034025 RepID=UPI0023E7A865|nr:polysaccharide biosynthesis protein [Halorussus sp. DT72]